MATISITLADSVLVAALNEAIGMKSSLDFFIEGAITAAISNPTVHVRRTVSLEKILDDALTAAHKIPPGERFLLKDLCGNSWATITTGERKIFGKLFRKSVETLLIAELVEKTSSNQAIYKRL